MRGMVFAAGELLLICGSLKAQIATTTTLTSATPAAPLFGQTVTLTAQVAPAAAPGTVSFMDGGVLVGVGTLNASGIAQMTTLTLPAGPHSLRVVYGGNIPGNYQPSQSATLPYLVTAVSGAGFTAASYGTATYRRSVAIGDFNADGKTDLAVANVTGDNVSVLLGNGNGTFQTAVNYGAGANPYSVAVGDFNGDGKVDLVVANDGSDGSNNVNVLLGNGNGTFQSAVSYPAGPDPASVAVGDLNGDGKADLAVAFNAGVSVLLGNGNGTFQSPINYSAGSSISVSVAVGDFNGDGKADLAVASNGFGNNMSVLLGNGNGTFQSAVNYIVPGAAGFVTLGDFNGDGKTDLVVANDAGNNINVLLGNGNGSFQSAVSYGAGSLPFSVAVTDFNGDGKPDLVVADWADSKVSLLLGNGNGTFQSAVNYGAGSPYSVAVGDFNGDGRADVASVGTSGGVIVMLGKAPPTTTITLQSAPNPSTYGQPVTLTSDVIPSNATGQVEFLDGTTIVGIGTLNQSGRAQITTTSLSFGARSLRAMYDGVPGLWQRSESGVVDQLVNALAGSGFAIEGSLDGVGLPAVGDFNGDGIADLAMAKYVTDSVSILLGNGNGTFQPAVSYQAGSGPLSVTAGDFNGDGKADLVVANYYDNNVSILLGNGNGTFQPAVSYQAGSGPLSVTVGDFNGDGKADLVVANYYDNNVSILLGNGDGSFQSGRGYLVGIGPESVTVGDFNADGRADLAVANIGGTVSVLLGNGNGTFQRTVDYTTGDGSTSVAVGDFNADGRADLVVANDLASGKGLSVLLGNGDGTFHPAVNYYAGVTARSVVLGDFNGDRKTDLAVSGGGLSVLLGNGDGTFQPFRIMANGFFGELAVSDFNGDGTADLASGTNIFLGIPPVSIVGVVPNTGSGAAQNFVGTYSTAFGFVGMLFASALDGGGQTFCLLYYDVQGNNFWLYGDGGFFLGPVKPGTPSNLLQNSLCALNTSASAAATQVGGALVLNFNLAFKAAGIRNIYMQADNQAGSSTPWMQEGTWTLSPDPLGTMTVNPASGAAASGVEQTFTLTYPDPAGFVGAAYGWEQFLVATASDGGGQPFCFVHYDRAANGLWMYSSDLGFFLGPVTPGTASSALNSSACSVNTAGATVQNSGGNLVLTMPITLKAPMVGTQKTFQRTLDVLNRDTGMVQSGTWTIQ